MEKEDPISIQKVSVSLTLGLLKKQGAFPARVKLPLRNQAGQ